MPDQAAIDTARAAYDAAELAASAANQRWLDVWTAMWQTDDPDAVAALKAEAAALVAVQDAAHKVYFAAFDAYTAARIGAFA